jgi:para-nitrobenzyl esterase
MAAASVAAIELDSGRLAAAPPDPNGVRCFKGIPYAAPPVGVRRWQPPAAPALWTGVRPSDRFGPRAMQGGRLGDIDPLNPRMEEDCLYLNVWTATAGQAAKLPVYVWFHGGGFTVGAGSEPWYDGANLARRGIVHVTVNYRLDVFGFLAHPDLGAGAGDYGLLDQIAALQWVQRNIAAFGGDPAQVTIGGESAGAASVSILMASPLARGLFARVIAQSAAFWPRKTIHGHLSLAEANEAGHRFQQDCGRASLEALRAMPARELLAASLAQRPKFLPVIGGAVSPADPADAFRDGCQNDVPLLAGWNADEGSLLRLRLGEAEMEGFWKTASERLGGRSEELRQLYGEGAAATEALLGDELIGYPMWKWIDLATRSGRAPVYQFYFDWRPPAPEKSVCPLAAGGAFHTAEIYYVMDTLHTRDWPWRVQDQSLRDAMCAYWIGFIKSGNPSSAQLPAWRPLQESGQLMRFGQAAGMQTLPHAERFRLLDRIYESLPAAALPTRTFG